MRELLEALRMNAGEEGAQPGALGTDVGSVALGLGLAVLSAVANGSFTVFSKLDSVKKSNVDPLVFNFWSCVGIVLSSLPFVFYSRTLYTPLGLISGLLFALSAANSYRAVRMIGVSVGTGVWSGTAVVVSFAAGVWLDPEGGVNTLLWAFVAIGIIVAGVVGVAHAGHMGRKASGQEGDLSSLLHAESDGDQTIGNFAYGFLTAIFAGILGGLIMIPLTWAGDEFQGVKFLPSFGVGVIIFAPLVTFLPYCTTVRQFPNLHPVSAALPGIISGIVWNIGNTFSILAIGYVSYSVAYPIMQTGLFVAGVWGMLLFDEICGNYAVTAFYFSGIVMVAGIALLAWASGS